MNKKNPKNLTVKADRRPGIEEVSMKIRKAHPGWPPARVMAEAKSEWSKKNLPS